MHKLDQSISEKVMQHLLDISGGQCTINEKSILAEESGEMREILTGLLFLHEELKFKEQQRQTSEKQLLIAKEQAEKANIAKSNFLSRMSHELRTPLNAILGFGQLLQLADNENLTDTQKDNVHQIIIAGDHLLSLINDVLDIARVDQGKLSVSMEKVLLSDVITASIALTEPQAQARGIVIENQINNAGLMVRADFTRLKQVLINLLSNAVKYNRVSGKITLQYEIPSEKRLKIRVTDTGNGLNKEQCEQVFKPFERLNVTNDTEGAGIGLTICKRLVQLMAGTIGVDSKPGEGSSFWVELQQSL